MEFKIKAILAGFVALGMSASANAGLIAHYKFNDNAEEASGNNVDLTAVGGASFAASVNTGLGQAATFDGNGDAFLAAAFIPSSTDDMTLTAWVYANTATRWGSIAKNWGNNATGTFHLGFEPSSSLISNYTPGGNKVESNSGLSLQSWHHIAVTLDSSTGTQSLFIDGSVAGTSGYTPPLSGSATGLGIGAKPNDTGTSVAANNAGFWDGLIDEVGVFDEALDSSEIASIYQQGLLGFSLDGSKIETNATAGVATTPTLALMALASFSLARRRSHG